MIGRCNFTSPVRHAVAAQATCRSRLHWESFIARPRATAFYVVLCCEPTASPHHMPPISSRQKHPCHGSSLSMANLNPGTPDMKHSSIMHAPLQKQQCEPAGHEHCVPYAPQARSRFKRDSSYSQNTDKHHGGATGYKSASGGILLPSAPVLVGGSRVPEGS